MTDQDARFADGDPAGHERLALRADDPEGLAIISALLQDAVGRTSEIAWMPKRRMFALVLNRFCWEDAARAQAEGRAFERVRAGMHAENVQRVRARGFDPEKEQQVFEVLSISFEANDAVGGVVTITCAGDACFALDVEALEVSMHDLDAHWQTRAQPHHPEAG